MYRYLGWADDWKEEHPVVCRCKAEGHYAKQKKIGDTKREVWCDICKYRYKEDVSNPGEDQEDGQEYY